MTLRSTEARRAREAMLQDRHIAPLTVFARQLQADKGNGYQIPRFDPLDGGIAAEVLFLLEAAGPQAVSTGFVSRDNPDRTASNFFRFNECAGICRKRAVLWNIVPWYIGDGARIRPANSEDITDGLTHLKGLLDLLPNLRVIVLLGLKAQSASSRIQALRPEIRHFASWHPSPLFVNRSKGNGRKIVAVLADVAAFLG